MYGEGMTQIRQALIEVVAEVARERGATLVLSKSQVVMASSAFDITEEVMQKLNAKLPEVSLAAPQ
jgi:Skp family chaperone for outer membrane proteins